MKSLSLVWVCLKSAEMMKVRCRITTVVSKLDVLIKALVSRHTKYREGFKWKTPISFGHEKGKKALISLIERPRVSRSQPTQKDSNESENRKQVQQERVSKQDTKLEQLIVWLYYTKFEWSKVWHKMSSFLIFSHCEIIVKLHWYTSVKDTGRTW